jgi:hypothetical protein
LTIQKYLGCAVPLAGLGSFASIWVSIVRKCSIEPKWFIVYGL